MDVHTFLQHFLQLVCDLFTFFLHFYVEQVIEEDIAGKFTEHLQEEPFYERFSQLPCKGE